MSVRVQIEVATSCPFHPARSLLFVCRLMAETPIWDRRLLQILQRASELEAVGIIISNYFFSPLRRARPRWRRLCAAVTRCVSAFIFCQMAPIMCSLAVASCEQRKSFRVISLVKNIQCQHAYFKVSADIPPGNHRQRILFVSPKFYNPKVTCLEYVTVLPRLFLVDLRQCRPVGPTFLTACVIQLSRSFAGRENVKFFL